MPTQTDGLPAHVLLVHAVVVLMPLAALMLMASAVWPAARRRLGVATPEFALVVLILCPITTHAGSWLRDRIDPQHRDAQITRHANLGNGLLIWAVGLFVLAAAVWELGRRFELSLRPAAAALPVWLLAALAWAVQSAGSSSCTGSGRPARTRRGTTSGWYRRRAGRPVVWALRRFAG